jgi:hypothetical protein
MNVDSNFMVHFESLFGFNTHYLIKMTPFMPILRMSGIYLPRKKSSFLGEKLKLCLGVGLSLKLNDKFVLVG